MTIADLRQKLKSGEVSSKELVQEKINRISELDPTLNSFLIVNTELALSKAEHIDNKIASGEHLSPLSGIPDKGGRGSPDAICLSIYSALLNASSALSVKKVFRVVSNSFILFIFS